jgi:hypothetical protein
MASTVIQTAGVGLVIGGHSQTTDPFPTTPTIGNVVFAFCSIWRSIVTPDTLTDSASNTWTLIGTTTSGSVTNHVYASKIVNTSATFTITESVPLTDYIFGFITAIEVSGLKDPSIPANVTGLNTALSTGTITSTSVSANAFMIAAASDDQFIIVPPMEQVEAGWTDWFKEGDGAHYAISSVVTGAALSGTTKTSTFTLSASHDATASLIVGVLEIGNTEHPEFLLSMI